MRKILLIFFCALLLSGCAADYSYSAPEDSASDEDRNDFKLEETIFISPYYHSLGEAGLEKLSENASILCLTGRHGTLLCANTPTRMIFSYETEAYVWQLMEYDKLSGQFAPACHDVMCSHDRCLFSSENKIFAGRYHLFFQPLIRDGGYYISALDGTDPRSLPIPADAFLHAETEEGLYWEKTELDNEKAFYSLWFYSFSEGNSKQISPPAENVSYYIAKDGIYLHDVSTLILYELEAVGGKKKKVAEGITAMSCFGGDLYDYDYETGTFRKLIGGKMVSVAHLEGVCDYWVSEGYIYYFCEDRAYMAEAKKEEELFQYLSKDNPTCGNIYRIKEGEETPRLLCQISHDGKPALIDHLFADGEVVYIQCRDYKSFPNRYNDEREDPMLVILDVQSGAFLEIPN